MSHAEQVFAHLTRALDLAVEADNLAGVLERDPLKGPCKAWQAAALEIWAAWEAANAARDEAYDIANEMRGKDDQAADV